MGPMRPLCTPSGYCSVCVSNGIDVVWRSQRGQAEGTRRSGQAGWHIRAANGWHTLIAMKVCSLEDIVMVELTIERCDLSLALKNLRTAGDEVMLGN